MIGEGGTRRENERRIGSQRSRGQTPEDFYIGISVFLVTVAFVLVLFPSFLTPFVSGVDANEAARADTVASSLVSNLSIDGEPNTLNATELRSVLGKSDRQFQRRYGLTATTSVNISVRTLDGDRIVNDGGTLLATDRSAAGRATGSTTRIVTLDNGACSPGCRLVVRVW
jgi:hypothetical protein